MKKVLSLVSALLITAVAFAGPKYNLKCDTQFPDRDLAPLVFLQGATPQLDVYIKQNGATYTNIATDTCTFYYGDNASSESFVIVTNSSVTTATGIFSLNFTSANLNTNGGFWYTVIFKDSSGNMYFSGSGELDIKKTTVTGSPSALILSTPLDWDGYVYSSPEDAPAVAGTGITATTNATSGQVTFSSSAGTTTTVSGGDGIDVTLTGADYEVAVDATVQRTGSAYNASQLVGAINDSNQSVSYVTTSNELDTLEANYATSSNNLVTLSGNYDTTSNELDTIEANYATSSNTLTLLNSNVVLKSDGGTFDDKVYSSVDQTIYAPASNELVTAGFARGLTLSGQQWYFTATYSNATYRKTTNFVALSTTTVAADITNVIASPITSDTYLVGGITTSLFSDVRSPINYKMWLARVGGNASSVLPVHMETYYVYQNETNQLGDWEIYDQRVRSTSPTEFDFSVSFNDPMITGSVYVVSYLKSGTVSGTAAGINIYGGGLRPSQLNVDTVPSGESFGDALHINGDNAMTGDINVGGQDITNAVNVNATTGSFTTVTATTLNVTNITVDKIFFADGGTNSWITMPSATSGVWRINGSNTIFNVILGQQ